MAGWDWYATYATGIAGIDDLTDHRARAAGLPELDSYNLWPLLSGKVRVSPRTELAIGDVGQVGGLISGGYKLLLGTLAQSGWTGQMFPNVTSHWDPDRSIEHCGNTTASGCLYFIKTDQGEHHNLASARPAVWEKMMKRLLQINETFFAPDRGDKDPAACTTALSRYGGFCTSLLLSPVCSYVFAE